MAQTYPNAKVIGLDAFPADDKRMKGYSNATISAPNIVYKYGDLTTPLTLPDDYIDVLYQRDTTSIIPHERWPFLFKELMRVMKPGGYIELVEYSMYLYWLVIDYILTKSNRFRHSRSRTCPCIGE